MPTKDNCAIIENKGHLTVKYAYCFEYNHQLVYYTCKLSSVISEAIRLHKGYNVPTVKRVRAVEQAQNECNADTWPSEAEIAEIIR